MRRIKQAKIRHISLVPRGANRLPVIYKSDGQTIDFDTIVKADMEEEGTITAIVYAPEQRDSQGDIASAEVIKQMAYEFAKSGEGVDIRHDEKTLPKDKAFVAESFIVQKGDPRFAEIKDYAGKKVDVTGAWATVIKIEDEGLRKEYREGKWNGISMGGTALVESEKEDSSVVESLVKMLKRAFSGRTEGDIDMSPEELKKALGEHTTAIAKSVTDGVTEALKAAGLIKEKKKEGEETKGDPAPVFKGDLSKEEDRRQHRKDLAIWKAKKDHADDPVALFDALEKIEKEYSTTSAEDDAAAGIQKEDSAEVRELKRKLHKAQRASNQPAERQNNLNQIDNMSNLSKEDLDLANEGRKSVKEFYGDPDEK